MSAIIDITAREILDSRGNPTVEVDVTKVTKNVSIFVQLEWVVDNEAIVTHITKTITIAVEVTTIIPFGSKVAGVDGVVIIIAVGAKPVGASGHCITVPIPIVI